MIKYFYLAVFVFLIACEAPAPSLDLDETTSLDSKVIEDSTMLDSNFEEVNESPKIDPEIFPEGLWIGKSYYDSLCNGRLTTLFIQNHLVSYFDEKKEANLKIGNAYGTQYGTVSLKNEQLYYKASYKEDKTEGRIEIIEKGNLQLLSTSNYWGYEDEILVKDSLYVNVGKDIGINKYNGFYCIEYPLKKLYFSGKYEVLNEKTGEVDSQILIDEQEIKNFMEDKDFPYKYESIFPGFNVICLAMEGQFYDINDLNRFYYLPSEHQYFIVEDVENGFLLYELLQPDLDNPKGCIEAHDIESDAVKGDLLYTFTKS
jgi:hypothetical protein